MKNNINTGTDKENEKFIKVMNNIDDAIKIQYKKNIKIRKKDGKKINDLLVNIENNLRQLNKKDYFEFLDELLDKGINDFFKIIKMIGGTGYLVQWLGKKSLKYGFLHYIWQYLLISSNHDIDFIGLINIDSQKIKNNAKNKYFGPSKKGYTVSQISKEYQALQNNGLEAQIISTLNSNTLNLKEILLLEKINDQNFQELIDVFYSDNVFMSTISNDLNIDIVKLSIQSQFHLLYYIYQRGLNDICKLKKSLNNFNNEQEKLNFLTSFLSCSKNMEMGNILIKLANQENSSQVFEAYAKLVDLQNELGEVDHSFYADFINSLVNKGEQLLLHYYKPENLSFIQKYFTGHIFSILKKEQKTDILEKFSRHYIKSASFIETLKKKMKKESSLTDQEFNEIAEGFFHISSFSGAGIIKEADNLSMTDEQNYLQSENFSKNDYVTICDIIKNKSDYHSGLSDSIIDDFKNSLQNKDAEFYIIRDNENTFQGIIKKEDKEKYCYLGNLYTVSDNQSYGIGSILEKVTLSGVNKEIKANCYIHSKAFLHHIEIMGGVGNFMIQDTNGNYNGLLDFIHQVKYNFQSKGFRNKVLIQISKQKTGKEKSIENGIIGVKIGEDQIENYLQNKLSNNNSFYLTRVRKAKGFYSLIIEEKNKDITK